MNKKEIKARIQIMMSLVEEARKIGDELTDIINPDDGLFDLLDSIYLYEATSVDEAMKELEDNYFLENGITEEGKEVYVPSVQYDSFLGLSVKKPCNGGSLIAYVNESDFNSSQAGVEYVKEGEVIPIDICLAEVKSNKQADNKDIDLYCYTDVYTEDYSGKHEIKYEDIKKALKEE